MLRAVLGLCFLTTTLALMAQQPPATSIRYVAERKLWLLTAGPTSYAFGVNEKNQLQHLYWAGALPREADLPAAHSVPEFSSFEMGANNTPDEYPGFGGYRYYEPSLKVMLPDGTRDLVLQYVSHRQPDAQTLEVVTKDIQYDLQATLIYRVYPSGIIEKRAVIQNRTRQPVTLESAQSGVWQLPANNGYRLSYLTGRWAGETQLMQEVLHPGTVLLDSRRGTTSHQTNPWFAIDMVNPSGSGADEQHGRVWFGALGWSGNWKISVEETQYHQVRVTGGLNTFDFSWRLAPGAQMETPPFYAGYSEEGFGGASRMFHTFQREAILPGGLSAKPRPVLYNSWEATEFAVDEAGQKALAAKAAKLGVERFVVDDGWFGARNDDHAGLGDWTVNRKKFPNGLGPLIQYVNSLGMDFGLWVEPEMVNPNSDLYRQHPDWAMHMANRPRTEARNQLILNLARADVKEYLFQALDKLATENNIAFFKWDMNRNFAEPGWPEAAPEEQKKLWYEYVRNLYEIIDRLRAKHPKLEIESCSGGGGRVDLGVLRRVEEVWTSDNTDAFDRLRIQEGFSYAYTPQIMMAWVTDVPNFDGRSTPLQYRFLVAMMGSLGIGANLNKMGDADLAFSTKMIAAYKNIRATVQQGRLYRLFSPRFGDLTANAYVAADGHQAVLFAFRHSQEFGRPVPAIPLQGLDPRANYRVQPMVEKALAEPLTTASGAYLMQHGVTFRLTGDYASAAVVLERVP